MLRKFNRCDFYIVLGLLYLLQGVLYQKGYINQILQVVLTVWNLIEISRYICSVPHKSRMLKASVVLLLMYLVYGLIFIISGTQYKYTWGDHTKSYAYLQISLNSILPIFLFYIYSAKGLLTERRIRYYGILFLVSFVLLYRYELQQTLLFYESIGSSKEEFTNNSAYYFLLLFPFLYYYKSKWVQSLCLFTILYFILIGMKRGAVLIGVCCLIIFVIHNWQQIKRSKSKLSYALCIILALGILGSYMNDFISGSDYFNERVQQTIDGDSSGRDILYAKMYNEFLYNYNIIEIIFGKGANSTIAIAGQYAHQDWLETLCNNGLLGVLLMAIFYFSIYREIMIVKHKRKLHIYHPFFLMFFICLSKTFFSMSIQDMQLCQTMILGYCSYKVNYEK